MSGPMYFIAFMFLISGNIGGALFFAFIGYMLED